MHKSCIGDSYELRNSLVGASGRFVTNSEVLQQPRVQSLVRDLVLSYDTGGMSRDAFRSRVLELGLMETPEASRLLQGSSLSLHAFLKALQSGNESLKNSSFGRPSDTPPPRLPSPLRPARVTF